MLVSVHLEIALILVQDRCTVCVEHTICSKIIVGCTRWISMVTLVMWNLVSVHLETVLVSVQDRCMVCSKHTIGSEIILDTPDGTPR
jgi:type IV secretory pathway TrbD component